MGGRDEVGPSGNAPRSEAGWVSVRDKLHGRVVEHRWVVEMAPPIIMIRRLTDEHGAQPRLASKRVRGLQKLRIGAPASIAWQTSQPAAGHHLERTWVVE